MRHPLMLAAVVIAMLAASTAAFAEDDINNYDLAAALRSEPGRVADDIGLYFAGQPHPDVAKTFGEFSTSKKTNAFGKSDLVACHHVFLSAVIELQERARKKGGNAVINIKSNYKNQEHASATEFTCSSGAVIAGVALKGEVVTLRR